MKAALALALALAAAACTVQTGPPSAAPVHEAPVAVSESPDMPRGAPAPGELTPHAPVECGGAEHVELVNVVIETDGTAVDASGACTITIVGSRIVGDIALDLHGSAYADVRDSVLEGGPSVEVHGSAVLSSAGTTYRGSIDRHGAASVDDRGGNLW